MRKSCSVDNIYSIVSVLMGMTLWPSEKPQNCTMSELHTYWKLQWGNCVNITSVAQNPTVHSKT